MEWKCSSCSLSGSGAGTGSLPDSDSDSKVLTLALNVLPLLIEGPGSFAVSKAASEVLLSSLSVAMGVPRPYSSQSSSRLALVLVVPSFLMTRYQSLLMSSTPISFPSRVT